MTEAIEKLWPEASHQTSLCVDFVPRNQRDTSAIPSPPNRSSHNSTRKDENRNGGRLVHLRGLLAPSLDVPYQSQQRNYNSPMHAMMDYGPSTLPSIIWLLGSIEGKNQQGCGLCSAQRDSVFSTTPIRTAEQPEMQYKKAFKGNRRS